MYSSRMDDGPSGGARLRGAGNPGAGRGKGKGGYRGSGYQNDRRPENNRTAHFHSAPRRPGFGDDDDRGRENHYDSRSGGNIHGRKNPRRFEETPSKRPWNTGGNKRVQGYCHSYMYREKCSRQDCTFVHGLKELGKIPEAHSDIINDVLMVEESIYTASKDGKMRTWRVTPDQRGRLEITADKVIDCGAEVCCLFYEANSHWLFCGLGSGVIRAFHKDTGAVQELLGHTQDVRSIILHQAVLISGCWDGTVKFWQHDAATGQFQCLHTVDSGPVKTMRVMSNVLWIGGPEGLVLFDLETMTVGKKIGKTGSVVMGMLEFSGHMMVSYLSSTLRVFTPVGEETFELKTDNRNFTISGMIHPSGAAVTLLGQSNNLVVYEVPDFVAKGKVQMNGDVRSILDLGVDGLFCVVTGNGGLYIFRFVDE